jgi:hypothetical protein
MPNLVRDAKVDGRELDLDISRHPTEKGCDEVGKAIHFELRVFVNLTSDSWQSKRRVETNKKFVKKRKDFF